jgi:hypothetical protein
MPSSRRFFKVEEALEFVPLAEFSGHRTITVTISLTTPNLLMLLPLLAFIPREMNSMLLSNIMMLMEMVTFHSMSSYQDSGMSSPQGEKRWSRRPLT